MPLQSSINIGSLRTSPVPFHTDPIVVIMHVVREYYGLSAGDMTGPSKERHIVWPRQIAMVLAKKNTKSSLPHIGRRFGGRHHSTVLHAVKAVADRRKINPQFAHDFSEIEIIVSQTLGRVFQRHNAARGPIFVSVRGK